MKVMLERFAPTKETKWTFDIRMLNKPKDLIQFKMNLYHRAQKHNLCGIEPLNEGKTKDYQKECRSGYLIEEIWEHIQASSGKMGPKSREWNKQRRLHKIDRDGRQDKCCTTSVLEILYKGRQSQENEKCMYKMII